MFYVIYERSLLIDRGDILSHWDPKFGLEDSIEGYNLAEAAHAHGKNCCCSFIFLQLEAYCSLALDVAIKVIYPKYSKYWPYTVIVYAVQLNKCETDPYFLQNFQSDTTVCLIIHEFCQSCDPEVVPQIKTKSAPRIKNLGIAKLNQSLSEGVCEVGFLSTD